MNKISEDDILLLENAISCAVEPPDDESVVDERSAAAFRDMLSRGRALSEKQRAWARRIVSGEPKPGISVDDWDIFHDY